MSIIRPKQLIAEISAFYNTGLESGLSTGWDALDRNFTVRPGEFTVVTGMPSHGKSEWLDALMCNLAIKHNFKMAIFSPENHPLQMHLSKIMEKYVGQRFHGFGRMDFDSMLESLEWVHKNFAFIVPNEKEFTPIHIVNEAADFIQHYSSFPKAVIIDPWNEMDHYRINGLSETEYISRILTELRRFAREFECHLFLVAHPMKMQKDKDGNYPVPRPYDISGSAHWYNKADNCISVWRDLANNPNLTQIHIQKVRFRGTGSPGMVEFIYNHKTARYDEPTGYSALDLQ